MGQGGMKEVDRIAPPAVYVPVVEAPQSTEFTVELDVRGEPLFDGSESEQAKERLRVVDARKRASGRFPH
jgi:hypothetical protein